LKNLLALEKSATFGGSNAAVADNAPAVERQFWRRSLFRQAAIHFRDNNISDAKSAPAPGNAARLQPIRKIGPSTRPVRMACRWTRRGAVAAMGE